MEQPSLLPIYRQLDFISALFPEIVRTTVYMLNHGFSIKVSI